MIVRFRYIGVSWVLFRDATNGKVALDHVVILQLGVLGCKKREGPGRDQGVAFLRLRMGTATRPLKHDNIQPRKRE